MGAAAAVAIRKMKEREVRAEFLRAGAMNPATAMSLADVGADDESRTVKRLRKKAIIREAAPGLFYFDDDVWEAFRSTQRRIALVLLVTAILIALVMMYGVVTLQ